MNRTLDSNFHLRFKLPFPHQMMKKACIKSNPTHLSYGKSLLYYLDEITHHFKIHLVGSNNVINLQFSPNKPISLVGYANTI